MKNLFDLTPRTALLLVALVSAAALGGAYLFQYVGGLAPCKMCLWQRVPYWTVIGLGGVVFFAGPGGMAKALLGLAGLAMAGNAGLGVYHAGVEQKWWEGPSSCTGTGGGNTLEDLQKMMEGLSIVRCDEIPWSLFGISLAGYSALISAGLAVIAIRALMQKKEPA